MEIINFGDDYYYPPEKLRKNLKKAIIFSENTNKSHIPNGSVFVYNSNEYDPSILNTDVGCGITSAITKEIGEDSQTIEEILKAVNEVGTNIGQGNHFLDITTGHPHLTEEGIDSSMIFLHSDFNQENELPSNYSEAKDLEKKAKDKRMEYLEKLTNLLEIPLKPYKDWTHNSVNKENGDMVYRKGAINLSETEGIGALALNPIEGMYLYVAQNKNNLYSMQHGTGRKASKGTLFQMLEKYSHGMARGYSIAPSDITQEVYETKEECYGSIDDFLNNFGDRQSQIGVCIPQLVVTNKNYAATR